MIHILPLRKNDINPNKGKQVEFGKSFFDSYKWSVDDPQLVSFQFDDRTIVTSLKIRGSERGGSRLGVDCKEYSNVDGKQPLKEYFIEKFSEKDVGLVSLVFEPLNEDGTSFRVYIVNSSKKIDEQSVPYVDLVFPLQQIYYGAPGTGKSNKVNMITSTMPAENVFRTTFHPDSDYSTFVGCYKPTKRPHQQRYNLDELSALLKNTLSKTSNATQDCVKFGFDNYYSLKEVGVLEVVKDAGLYSNNNDTHIRAGMSLFEENGVKVSELTYEFVPQVFVKAYVRAHQTDEPVFLVIEEINRGNCAQIFGDIFQLLDRDENGVSNYAIKPDSDLEQYLIEHVEDYKPEEGMRLPNNLHIRATKNTSDQSLFPIDSAFKRRWDWTYMPIDTKKESWKINIGKGYSWSSFLEKVNSEIEDTTSSEDKMLGFYFCKAVGGVVSKETFVGKVLFYIYNDVFKDYDHNRDFFIDKVTSKKIRFKDFYKMDGTINEPVVEKLLENLTVESFEPEKGESGETE